MLRSRRIVQFFSLLILLSSTLSAGVLKNEYPFNKLSNAKFINTREVKIAIIDTGIDYSNINLRNSLISLNEKGNVIPGSSNNFGVDDSHKSNKRYQPIDDHGHGTHIAGIIHEINPSAKLLPIKYYNLEATEEENLKATVRAIYTAIKAKVDIINYSSGGEGYSQDEYDALKVAKEKGILVVAAAGNFGKNIDIGSNAYYPASYNLNNIISVMNLDKANNVHPTSNYGKENADLASFGTDVTSFLPSGKIGSLSGTSQATAIISAYASLMISSSNKEVKYTTIKNYLLSSTRKLRSLRGKCKTEATFDSGKFINQIKDKVRRVAQTEKELSL